MAAAREVLRQALPMGSLNIDPRADPPEALALDLIDAAYDPWGFGRLLEGLEAEGRLHEVVQEVVLRLAPPPHAETEPCTCPDYRKMAAEVRAEHRAAEEELERLLAARRQVERREPAA